METILLIEDNTDIRENATEVLFLEGYLVIAISCGLDIIRLYPDVVPDLVLCDIKMPEMDGYQIYDTFQSSRYTRHIPFVFMTALSERKDREKAAAHGIAHYLIKPFDDAQLLDHIRSSLFQQKSRVPPNLRNDL